MKKSGVGSPVVRSRRRDGSASETPRVTLATVAKAAGVSPGTVSRVINRTARVAESKAQAVRSAIVRLGFEPNPAAQWLAKGKTHSIGVITQGLNSPYFGEALASIERELRRASYSPVFVSGNFRESDERECFDFLLARRVDGVILLTSCLPDAELKRLSARVPLVVTGRSLKADRVCCVDADNTAGAQLATDFLLGLGHREIAFITGPEDHPDARQRLRGYKAALATYDVPFQRSLVVAGDYREAGGFDATVRLFRSGVSFTAIFAANDQSAYGALLAVYKQGLRVPQAISVVGFDDLPASPFTVPPLTTVHRFTAEIGETAARSVVDMIDGRRPESRIPSATLAIRESTRSLRV